MFEEEFGKAVERALQRPDVQAKLDDPQTQVDPSYLRSILSEQAPHLKSQLGTVEQEVASAASDLDSRQAERDTAISDPWYVETLMGVAGLLFLALMVVGGFWVTGNAAVRSTVAGVFQLQQFSTGHTILAACGIPVLLLLLASLRWSRRRRRLEPTLDETFGISTAKTVLEAAQKRYREQLDRVIGESIFEIIGVRGVPFYQDSLVRLMPGTPALHDIKASSPRALSEASGSGNEISTQERREIVELLESLLGYGASIGLSGPRGAGKSTLLRSLTAANLPLRDKKAIAIYTAAPVEYDSREFLLHIFSTLCKQVLRTHQAAETTESDPWNIWKSPAGPFDWAAKLFLPLFLFGLLATALAFVLGLALQSSAQPPGLLQTMDVKPGDLFLFGITALTVCVAALLVPLVQGNPAFLRAIRAQSGDRAPARSIAQAGPEESALVRESRQHLAIIRFQRSFTSGWSGSIKMPIGLDTGTSSSTSLAERQESLPELVERFSTYVRQVAAEHGAVIIAIDELDKLKSGVEAEKFVNEIKSIFSIPHCFYLVSVSEDALTSFERRGLALRDAFDSAFDEIRYIGYMDLAGCRRMLLRRILDLPDPFLCLCYMLSGGLPRDLIRGARDMFELVDSAPIRIDLLGEKLLRQEAETKIRASGTATRNIKVEPETSKFMLGASLLQHSQLGDPNFEVQLQALLAPERATADQAELSKLRSIQRELIAYLSFLGELLKTTRQMATLPGWERSTSSGRVDRIAEVRRAMEFNASAAAEQLKTLPA